MIETSHIPTERYTDRVFTENTVVGDTVIPKGMRLIDVFPNGVLITERNGIIIDIEHCSMTQEDVDQSLREQTAGSDRHYSLDAALLKKYEIL